MQPQRPLLHHVDTSLVLSGRFDPRSYPLPYLAIVSGVALNSSAIDALLTAAGMLREHGWELINIANTGGSVVQLAAFLKRI